MVRHVHRFEGMRLVTAMLLLMGVGCADEGPSSANTEYCGNGEIELLSETCDDGNTVSGDGCSSTCQIEETVTAHWTLENSAGEAQLCPDGFDTAAVVALTLRVGITVASFPCVYGEGTFEMYETPRSPTLGFYLELRRAGTRERFSETPSFDHLGDPTVDHRYDIRFKVITDIGKLGLRWSLPQAPGPTSCEQLGVDSIRIDLIPADGPTITLTDKCDYGFTHTGFLKTGTYRVEMTATSARGMGFGARDGVEVPTGGQTGEIPQIDIVF
jgi:cysteine-rich repeat protein